MKRVAAALLIVALATLSLAEEPTRGRKLGTRGSTSAESGARGVPAQNSCADLMEQNARLLDEGREAKATVESLKAELAEARAALAAGDVQREEYQRTVDRLEAEVTDGRGASSDLALLRVEADKLGRKVRIREDENTRLLALAQEILEAYRDKGFWSVLLQKEPLTQIKRAELEKIVEEYRERLEAFRRRASPPLPP
jgi:hypothetical protein